MESQPIPAPSDPLDKLIDVVLSGEEIGYKKAVVIQAAGKAADPTLDAQAMQKGDGNERSWDAREFAKQSFVKWNLEANKPFAHSADPYVSNPYRIPRFDSSQRRGRKRPREFDNTLLVLEHLGDSPFESQQGFSLSRMNFNFSADKAQDIRRWAMQFHQFSLRL
ncbi:hypothetical protein GCM10023264_18460 [Sphingomonas daechungensis]